jgi:hypothetical protein
MGDVCAGCHDRRQDSTLAPEERFAPFEVPDKPWHLAVSPDGSCVAVADHWGIRLWDVAQRRWRAEWEARGCMRMGFSPDGERLAWGTFNSTGTEVLVQRLGEGRPRKLTGMMFAFLPDRAGLAVWGDELARHGKLTVCDAEGTVRVLAEVPRLHTVDLACAPHGGTVAGACGEQGVVFWDLVSGAETRLPLPGGPAKFLAYHPDGGTLAVLQGDPSPGVALLDPAAPAVRARVESPNLAHPVFCPAQRALVARANPAPPLRILDADSGAARGGCDFPGAWTCSLAAPAGADWLAVGCIDRTVRFIPAEVLRG